MNDNQITTAAAVGVFVALALFVMWRGGGKSFPLARLARAAVQRANISALARKHLRPLTALVAAIALISAWAYFGRSVVFDSENPAGWINGTLEIQGNTATARLHNNRDGWIVERVTLYVISGKAKPCKKGMPDCRADGGLASISVDDAERRGSYRCVPKAAAVPNSTFECSFIYPYTVGWGYRFHFVVDEIEARRVNPLGL